MTEITTPSSRAAIRWILVISVAASGLLIWLIYGREPAADGSVDVSVLPAVNALLNAMSALCVCLGYYFVRRRRLDVHRGFMLAAMVFSMLFLASYLVYHYYHGDTPFLGEGLIRPIYFTILISHIVLSVVVLPLVMITLYFAFTGQFNRHPRIARVTLPIWLYVSVTGVLVFFLLNRFG